jgi:glycolate oxidase FAD binding subunit
MSSHDATEAIVAAISEAYEQELPLRIRGGNTRDHLGCRRDGTPLDMSAHCGIVDYEPNELVMTVRSGTRLEQIDSTLAEQNQMLGFEPPRYSPASTLGGTLACNSSGSGRPWRGSVRDAVLGIRLINGRGERLRFGGRVIKNVAGFDAARLQAGAFGALGVITELSFKVLPKPETSVTLVQERDAGAAIRHMNELAATPAPVSGLAWTKGRELIRLEGNASAVGAAASSIGGERADASIWSTLRDLDTSLAGTDEDGVLWRCSVSSTAEALLEDTRVIDWAGALRFVRNDLALEQMSDIARSAGGHVMRLSHNTDGSEFLQQPTAAVRGLHERLKQAFDPARIFNPGRLYGWL